MFNDGSIDGVLVRPLQRFRDQRGWLVEFFRSDELDATYLPAMGYISETLPGIARGPHEHVEQADLFAFLGPSTFKVYCWDNRSASRTYRVRMALTAGADQPTAIVIPPGVVHAYKNIGTTPGWVVNCPNRLYAGAGRREPVDEIRHESRPDNPFVLF